MPGSLIVTGGGRGIGAATAKLAAARGYAVCVNYLSRTIEAEAVAAAIRGQGGRALALAADVTDAAAVEAMVSRTEAELGPLAGLVNNAGLPGPRLAVADLDPATLRRILEVNVLGSFLCAGAAVRRMSTAAGGRGGGIVNLSSQAAVGGGRLLAAYASAKAAVNTFTLALAREVAADGIRVNAVSPGVIATDQNDLSDPDRAAGLAASVPLGRVGEPREVAEAILWLLSPASGYVTGTVLSVSGGR